MNFISSPSGNWILLKNNGCRVSQGWLLLHVVPAKHCSSFRTSFYYCEYTHIANYSYWSVYCSMGQGESSWCKELTPGWLSSSLHMPFFGLIWEWLNSIEQITYELSITLNGTLLRQEIKKKKREKGRAKFSWRQSFEVLINMYLKRKNSSNCNRYSMWLADIPFPENV